MYILSDVVIYYNDWFASILAQVLLSHTLYTWVEQSDILVLDYGASPPSVMIFGMYLFSLNLEVRVLRHETSATLILSWLFVN